MGVCLQPTTLRLQERRSKHKWTRGSSLGLGLDSVKSAANRVKSPSTTCASALAFDVLQLLEYLATLLLNVQLTTPGCVGRTEALG